MNRLLTLTFLLLPLFCSSQNYSLCMQVVAASGGNGAQGNYDVSWTVGELVITTVTGVNNKVTQGFHQPDICTPVSTWNLDLEAMGIDVFPNPATSFFTIRYTDTGKSAFNVEAFDVLGNQVLRAVPLDTPSGTLIDASAWPAGIYFLQVKEMATKATAIIRMVRL